MTKGLDDFVNERNKKDGEMTHQSKVGKIRQPIERAEDPWINDVGGAF